MSKARQVRPAVSKAYHYQPAATKYQRPPSTDGNRVTREAKEMYLPAWHRLTRGPK